MRRLSVERLSVWRERGILQRVRWVLPGWDHFAKVLITLKTPECIWCSQHCLADSGSAAVDEPRTFWHSSHRQEVKPRWTAFFSGCVSVDVPSPSGHVKWSLWNQLQSKFWFLCLCLRADEDNESSSSEDDDEDRRRLNDELLGQVCSIENEEESSTWFLALVNWHSYCIKWGWCYNYLMYVMTNHCRWNIHVTLLKWGKGLFSCCQKVSWDVIKCLKTGLSNSTRIE